MKCKPWYVIMLDCVHNVWINVCMVLFMDRASEMDERETLCLLFFWDLFRLVEHKTRVDCAHVSLLICDQITQKTQWECFHLFSPRRSDEQFVATSCIMLPIIYTISPPPHPSRHSFIQSPWHGIFLWTRNHLEFIHAAKNKNKFSDRKSVV